jgi:hypothetical protein
MFKVSSTLSFLSFPLAWYFAEIYYERYLKIKLNFSVYMPMRDKVISKLWTNNNAESIKEVVDWKQHSLPDLTDKIKTVSNIQFNNMGVIVHGIQHL